MNTFLQHWAESVWPSAPYAWLITADHLFLAACEADAGTHPDESEVGVMGPGWAPEALLDRLKAGEGVPFKMYDDDKELYYEGLFLADNLESGLPDEAFGPLWQFGTPNAGCTEIHYKNSKGEWEQL